MGGSKLDEWQDGSQLYETAVGRTREAMKSGELAGILWHQGESESTPALADTYVDRLRKMMGKLRGDLKAKDVPVVIGELNYGYGNNDTINPELAKAVKKIPHAALVSSEALGKKQEVHFNSADLREFGKRYAAAYLKLVKP